MSLTIVVGYDGSDCAKAALEQALGLAGPGGKCHHLRRRAAPHGSSRSAARACRGARQEAHGRGPQVARQRGVPAEVVLEGERPAEALIKVAARTKADIIAVAHAASRSSPAFARLHPYHLVHRATLPLLVVPPKAA